MAENNDQNNLEESVRSMIKDRIAKMRDKTVEKKETVTANVTEAVKPEVKTEQPVIGAPSKPEIKAAGSKQESSVVSAPKPEPRVEPKPEPKAEQKQEKAPELSDEEMKKAAEEEKKKEAEALKEEQRKQREAEKEKAHRIKEEQKAERDKEKEAARAEREKQREAARAEKENLRQAAKEEKEKLKEIKAAEKAKEELQKQEQKTAAAAESGDDAAFAGVPGEETIHKEGMWKSIVERMNSESAGDDELGRDIEDESADEIFISPEEKKRKRAFGFVKLYGTLGAIAAIAIIIAFFTVRNNSFRHIYEQGVRAYNEEDYDSALATFEKLSLSEEGEHNIEVLNYLAEIYVKKNRYQDALDVYNRALQADPTFGPAVTGLCEMYTRMKDGKSLNATLDKYRGTNMEEFIADYMVKNPSVNPDAGKYEEDLELAVTGEQNVPVFYTLDGSEPNEQSQLYTKPIKVSEGTTTIKAISINTLGIRSGIIEKQYTVEYRIPNEPKIALNSGIYVTGQTVTISGDEGCDIYYTTDGSTPTKYSEKYTGPLRLVKGNVILTAVAISNHDKESPIASKNYIIVQNARELEEVENMNRPTTVPSESTQEGEETQEGDNQETQQNPNETDSQYLDEYEYNEGDEEGLFDWLFNDRRN